MKKILLISLCFPVLFTTCKKTEVDYYSENQNSLDIYDIWKQNSPTEKDSNGYYHFSYNPTGHAQSDYGTVKYFTDIPVTRVYWSSPDSFFVYHMNQLIGQPIINYSTYSDSDGHGHQLFYVYSDFIEDTLTIYGYIDSNASDTVFVIID